jgi:RND family efflux transporter MFP subunit
MPKSNNNTHGPGNANDDDFAAADRERPDPQWHRVPVNYSSNTGRFLAIGAGVLALSLAIGFYFMQRYRSRESASLRDETAKAASAPAIVDFVTVKDAPKAQPLVLPGETQAWNESTIYARVSGYLQNWFVDIGDKVNKGKVLATIETPELDAQLRAADAKLKAAEAQVDVEQANSAFAKSTWERWRDSPGPVVSEQEREAKKADYNSSVAKLEAAKAQVNLNQADVESLMALTHFKEVTAPYDGVITSRRIDIGDLVTAGSTNSTTSLFTIAQSDTIRVFVDVPQIASSEVTVGMPVVATTSEFPGRKFEGKITRTANAIDPVSRTLHVEADIPNTAGPHDTRPMLVPGMYVEVSFDLVKRALLQVPASALLFRSSGSQVAVVGPDGKISFRTVTIAMDQGDYVEIDSGLSLGDHIALNISSQIDDGDIVSANDVDPPEAPAPPARPTTSVTSADPGR